MEQAHKSFFPSYLHKCHRGALRYVLYLDISVGSGNGKANSFYRRHNKWKVAELIVSYTKHPERFACSQQLFPLPPGEQVFLLPEMILCCWSSVSMHEILICRDTQPSQGLWK